eukprot:12906291-Prorocentrum_lima.AAC.1
MPPVTLCHTKDAPGHTKAPPVTLKISPVPGQTKMPKIVAHTPAPTGAGRPRQMQLGGAAKADAILGFERV